MEGNYRLLLKLLSFFIYIYSIRESHRAVPGSVHPITLPDYLQQPISIQGCLVLYLTSVFHLHNFPHSSIVYHFLLLLVLPCFSAWSFLGLYFMYLHVSGNNCINFVYCQNTMTYFVLLTFVLFNVMQYWMKFLIDLQKLGSNANLKKIKLINQCYWSINYPFIQPHCL